MSTAGGVDSRRDVGIDPGIDLHTHSDLTDGSASPELMADAAVRAGLHTWGLSDHVRADSGWVGEYAHRVAALRRPGLRIRCGVEAKMLDTAGRLDVPAGLPRLDYILVADHQYPSREGPQHPRAVAAALRAGSVTAVDVVQTLITASAAALRRAPAPPILAHPFSLLPKLGLTELLVGPAQLDVLAAACLAAGAAVEVNEKWRCPSAALVHGLRERGVPLVVGSDAHRVEDVGVWRYVGGVLDDCRAVHATAAANPPR